MRHYLTIAILLSVLNNQVLFAQTPTLSEKAQISVLTCSSGDELFSAFGHTAFRVQDAVLGIDVVYNYGTFDFDKPNFYLNFAQGKLIYSLSRRSFEAFLYTYQLEKRWVKEQVLNLTAKQTNELFRFFEQNHRPENRDYPYDPLFNNCSSITGDVLEQHLDGDINFKASHLKEPSTFRQLVHKYIPINSWGAFGIDLAFGGITDQKASARQHMFLPYYTMYQLRNTELSGEDIVMRERTILNYPEKSDQSTFLTSPLFWFCILLAFTVAITLLDKKHQGRNRWLDFGLFFISGLAGLIVLLLWVATDHVVTDQNFNFLWLLPTNLIVGFYLLSKKQLPPWLSKYLWAALGLIGLSLIFWVFRVHVLSPINIPLMGTLGVRYLFLLKKI